MSTITLDIDTLDRLSESPEEFANFAFEHAAHAPEMVQAFTAWVCAEDGPREFTPDQCATVSALVGMAYLRLGLFGLPEGAEVRDIGTDEPVPESVTKGVLLSSAYQYLDHALAHDHPIAWAMQEDTNEMEAWASAVGWVLDHTTVLDGFDPDTDGIPYL